MKIKICQEEFEDHEINNIIITNDKVLVDLYNDFQAIRYTSKDDIQEAEHWVKFQNTGLSELREAVALIIYTCSKFVNEKAQCLNCPLQRKEGCIFTTIPINWR